ncbi:MAG: hypothetical protein KDD82_26240, partial [Planctomycetes bacterium]|nr:hypothetical protein [Planctomycetota bacterium]
RFAAREAFSPEERAELQRLLLAERPVEVRARILECVGPVDRDASAALAAAREFRRLGLERWEVTLLDAWRLRSWRAAVRFAALTSSPQREFVLPPEVAGEVPPTALALARAEARSIQATRGEIPPQALLEQIDAALNGSTTDLTPGERLDWLRLRLTANALQPSPAGGSPLFAEVDAALAALPEEAEGEQVQQLLFAAAQLAQRTGDLRRAARYYRGSLRWNPASPSCAAPLAWCLAMTREEDPALRLASWLLTLPPRTEGVGLAAVAACCALSRGAGLESELRAGGSPARLIQLGLDYATQLGPGSVEAHKALFMLCSFCRERGAWDELERLARLGEGWDPRPLREYAAFRALCRLEQQTPAAAWAFVREDVPPEDRPYVELRLALYLDRTRAPQDEDLRRLAEAHEGELEDASLTFQVARAWVRLDQAERGLALLRRLRARAPESPGLARELAEFEEREGVSLDPK